MNLRRSVAAGLAAVLLPVTPLAWAQPARAAVAGTLAPSAPLTNVCGVVDPASVMAPPSAVPDPAPKVLATGVAPTGLAWKDGRLYLLDAGRSKITVYDAAGAVQRTVALGWTGAAGPAVDGAGDVYVTRPPYEIVKLTGSGEIAWTRKLTVPVARVFGQQTAAGWRAGVVTSSTGSAALFDAAGNAAGSVAVRGRFFSEQGSQLVAADGRYVRVHDAQGAVVSEFGDRGKDNDPMPAGAPRHFYQQGGAVRLADGGYLVADGQSGVAVVSPEGLAQGFAPAATLGGLTEASPMVTDGTTLFYASGPKFSTSQSLSAVPVAQILATAARPAAPAPRLGYGAGLWVDAGPGKFYAPGETPTVRATFDGWWSRIPGLTLEYTVRDRHQVLNDEFPPAVRVPVDDAVIAAGHTLALPPARPGFYEVEAKLYRGAQAISGTCVKYGIAAPGQDLDITTLPGTVNAGGPDPARGVALADILGTGLFRDVFDWQFLLPADPTAPLNFSRYDAEIAAGAAASAARGVPFVMQVGSGGPEEKLVADGTWEARVRELVSHYRDQVDYWEAWNEPNITYGPASTYVEKVLKPFYRAVKAADPTAKVVGGDPVNISVPYWEGIGYNGGFAYLDILGLHPYTGHNRSFEEEGSDRSMGQLRDVMAKYGVADKPIWVTEHAWWSNGPANYFSQADFSARAMLWYRKWGIERWSYFLAQGTWGNSGVTFSAIEGQDYVKPAAAALMTVKTQVGKRPFEGMVDIGVPHTYVQRYGAEAGGGDSVLAAWTDDMPVTVLLKQTAGAASAVTVSVVDVTGDSTPVTVPASGHAQLYLDGSPRYVRVPAGVSLTLQPAESWDTDLALKSGGATATASTSGAWNAPGSAIDGISDARTQGDFRSSPAWAQAPGDLTPTLTVTLPKAATVNRAVVSTVHLGSVLTGVAAVTLSARRSDGTWAEVARKDGIFYQRTALMTFPPVTTDALRLVVRAVNFGGYAGGAMPHFWATDPASLADGTKSTYGPAIVRELEVYAVGSAIQDVTAPAPPVVVVAGSFGADQEAALPVSGSAEPGSRMAVRIEVGGRTSVPVTTTAGAGGTWAVTLNTTGLPAGPAWVTATATDALGNTSQPGRAASHKTSGAPPIPPRPPVPPTTGTPVPPTTSTPLPPTTGTPGPTSPNPPTVATPTPAHTLLGQNGGQSAPAGAPYAKPLGVRVLDAAQRPVAGRKVVFTGASTGARVGFPGTTASVVTNAQGWAYSPTVRAGAVVGTVHVTASTSTAAPLQLRLTITPSVTAVPRTRLVRAGTVLKAGGPLTVSVWGRGGVPGGAAKAAIEVTTSGSAAGGSVRLSPTGRWAASDVRAPVTKGRLRTTLLMAPIGPDGRIRLRNDSKGAVAVSIELQGWLTSGARMSVPARTVGRLVLDTAAGGGSNGLARNRPVAVPVARKGAARSALVRIVVTSRVRGGHLFAYPHGGRRPSIPVAPVSAGAVSRTALLPVGRDGRIALYSSARPGLQASVRVIALYR